MPFLTKRATLISWQKSISQGAKFVLGKIPKNLVIFLGKTTKANFGTWGKIIQVIKTNVWGKD